MRRAGSVVCIIRARPRGVRHRHLPLARSVGACHGHADRGRILDLQARHEGVYQHCAKKHLHRYVTEFEFRYTLRERTGYNDAERSEPALRGIVGKRITHRASVGKRRIG